MKTFAKNQSRERSVRKVLRKILSELILIREELQGIRSAMEPRFLNFSMDGKSIFHQEKEYIPEDSNGRHPCNAESKERPES